MSLRPGSAHAPVAGAATAQALGPSAATSTVEASPSSILSNLYVDRVAISTAGRIGP